MSNHDDLSSLDFITYEAPRTDWGWVLDKFYRKKTININISLTANTVTALDNLIDDFKYNISLTEWKLEITIWWIVRQRKATLTKCDFNRKYHNITFIQDISLTFVATNPHWYNKNNDSNSYYDMTWDFNEEIIYQGTAQSYPKIYFIFWVVSDLENTAISVNWIALNIEETITTWDILLVDWEEKEVTLNWTAIKYSWPFPIFNKWANPISFIFSSWATLNCDITIINKRKYL